MTGTLDELTMDVTVAAGRLAGSAEAAAVLESLGVGDERARAMGQANVFRLAAEVVEEQDHSPEALEARTQVEAERRHARLCAHGAVAAPARFMGAATAIPVATAVGAVAVLTASLWNDGPTGIERATAVGLAAATSLPVAAGFVLAMASRGAGPHRRGITAAGVLAAVVAGLGLWGLLSGKALVAPAEVGVTLQYFALLSALWIASGLAIPAGRVGWLTLAFALGTGTALALRLAAGTSLVSAQRAGILAAAAIATVTASWPANGERRRAARDQLLAARAPRDQAAQVLRGVGAAPLVLFGTGLGAMLFMDRAATWYSQSPVHSWILALRPDAEAGWTCALVAMLGGFAAVAASARGFGAFLATVAERTPLTAGRQMSVEVQFAHRRAVRRLLAASVLGAPLSFVAMLVLMAASTSFSNVVTRDTAFVFAIVGPGLVLVAWGVLDASILFAMRRPAAPVLGILVGLAVDAAVAVVLAKTAAGWTAAAGLVAGAAVFWAVTTLQARRMLRNPDTALAGRG